jgi:hypothetical protein
MRYDKMQTQFCNGTIISNKKNENIELVLRYMGIDKEIVRKDAFNRWKRFIEFCNSNSGEYYSVVRCKLRYWLGIDFRYIDAYFDTCLACGIIQVNSGVLVYKGKPEESEQKSLKDKIESGEIKQKGEKIK